MFRQDRFLQRHSPFRALSKDLDQNQIDHRLRSHGLFLFGEAGGKALGGLVAWPARLAQFGWKPDRTGADRKDPTVEEVWRSTIT